MGVAEDGAALSEGRSATGSGRYANGLRARNNTIYSTGIEGTVGTRERGGVPKRSIPGFQRWPASQPAGEGTTATGTEGKTHAKLESSRERGSVSFDQGEVN